MIINQCTLMFPINHSIQDLTYVTQISAFPDLHDNNHFSKCVYYQNIHLKCTIKTIIRMNLYVENLNWLIEMNTGN